MRRRFMNYSTSIDYSNYLTIEAIEDVSVLFSVEVQWTTNGRKWETSNRVIAKAGQLVSIKRNTTQGESLLASWSGGAYNLRGNIMSLLFGDDAKGKTSMLGYSLQALFENSNVITVEKGFLPATILSNYCYEDMFNGCTSLTTAPELPATTLADYYCYANMFQRCTSLVNAPELPATTLTRGCYQYMFNGCSKLNHIKMLATNISALDCLYNWVSGVASGGTFVKNPEATWEVYGDDGIPNGWTVKFDGEEDKKIENYLRKGMTSGPMQLLTLDFPAETNLYIYYTTSMQGSNMAIWPKGNSTHSLGLGPGDSIVSIDRIEPNEDDFYIYKIAY